jgi:hypothetical protein
LPAIGLCQAKGFWMIYRFREQARSYRFCGLLQSCGNHWALWELACQRLGCVRRSCSGWSTAFASRLAPTGFVGYSNLVATTGPCGSWLASDWAVSGEAVLDGSPHSRAGSLPQVLWITPVLWQPLDFVGAGLPAIGLCQASLFWMAHRIREQARSHRFWVLLQYCGKHRILWELACQRMGRVRRRCSGWPTAFAGKPAPTGFGDYSNPVATTENCGSWLASDWVGSGKVVLDDLPLSRAGSLLQLIAFH